MAGGTIGGRGPGQAAVTSEGPNTIFNIVIRLTVTQELGGGEGWDYMRVVLHGRRRHFGQTRARKLGHAELTSGVPDSGTSHLSGPGEDRSAGRYATRRTQRAHFNHVKRAESCPRAPCRATLPRMNVHNNNRRPPGRRPHVRQRVLPPGAGSGAGYPPLSAQVAGPPARHPASRPA
ncbi:Hypp2517 [Branchiostoma lanceolatum]|uniref:Hypp2517 protein n=1 Tax=Branchiostoma lanceolatum TaxID=7740 RepID=A0A8J9ZRF4_BRALA|nr:Hypp2517 [Branchiostoma lanceolatum]